MRSGWMAVLLVASLGFAAGCRNHSETKANPDNKVELPEPDAPKPGKELDVPDDYHGPIDPMWPPSHPADLPTELEAAKRIRARIDAGEDVDMRQGKALLEGDHQGIYAHEGHIGGFDYLEIILGDVKHPDDELPLLVLIHGRGQKPAIPRGPLTLDPPMRIFMPRGPDPLGDGYHWIATYTNAGETELLARSLAARVDQLAPAIEAFRQLRKTRGKPVIMGFSQGAIMTFGLYARRPELFAAAYAAAGWLPDALLPVNQAANDFPHLHALHGSNDKVVPTKLGRESIEKMKALGLNVAFTEVPGVDHRVTMEMNATLRRWLQGLLAPERFPFDWEAEHKADFESDKALR